MLTSSATCAVQVLQNRGYVELRAKALRPLERGQRLSTMLVAHLGQFVEPAFTSRLESDLDAISAGELDSTSFPAQWSVPSLPPLEPCALTERRAPSLATPPSPGGPRSSRRVQRSPQSTRRRCATR